MLLQRTIWTLIYAYVSPYLNLSKFDSQRSLTTLLGGRRQRPVLLAREGRCWHALFCRSGSQLSSSSILAVLDESQNSEKRL